MTAVRTGYGPIINDTSGRATTLRQIGGTGVAFWKQLAYGAHLEGAWNTVEHVTLTAGASIGEHLHDRTEEIYYIVAGQATMRMNGVDFPVGAGDLITTPIGARHAIENDSGEDMAFYVTEVFPGEGPPARPRHLGLHHAMAEAPGYRDAPLPLRVAAVDLTEPFTGPWHRFARIEVPPGARTGDYALDQCTEVVFVVSGQAAVVVEGQTFTGGAGFCAAFPAGAERRVENISARRPLCLISTEVRVP
ncbi:cupin domain-containing protein [Actinomadura rubrisoli]|uniref:Cupin domain-containing protein n=1 Tax=Actinomadura rubrisoli TaxID=2530368 RepID=A0A4R4ZPE9_9ACTN|nr:cupin domain-containing protein [Actinomadura rubrisoli]TDD60798.1 cupin domain-containing protein [Actinomadura rubrisoli]